MVLSFFLLKNEKTLKNTVKLGPLFGNALFFLGSLAASGVSNLLDVCCLIWEKPRLETVKGSGTTNKHAKATQLNTFAQLKPTRNRHKHHQNLYPLESIGKTGKEAQKNQQKRTGKPKLLQESSHWKRFFDRLPLSVPSSARSSAKDACQLFSFWQFTLLKGRLKRLTRRLSYLL